MGSCHIQVDTTSPFNKRIGLVSVEGHLWKAQWKEKPNDEGRKKLTM